MKTITYIFVVFLATFSVSAQQVTHKDVAGRWKAVEMGTKGALANLETGKVSVSDDWKKNNPGQDVAALEEKLKKGGPFTNFVVSLTEDGRISLIVMGKVSEEGRYTLEPHGDKTVLQGGPMGDDEMEVTMPDGRMQWYIRAQDLKILFKKIQ